MSYRIGVVSFVVCVALAGGAVESFAQSATSQGPRWEFEVHAGGVGAGNPSRGRATAPAAGDPFTTVNGRPSRYVTSWYFGDGAVLANEHAAAFSNILRNSRIASLDPVLTESAARPSNRGSIGFRVSRYLTPRFSAEFAVDFGPSRLELSQPARDNIEATRASFERFWTELLASANPLQFQNKVVVSSAEIADDGGAQIVTTGAINVKLRREGALIPHVTGGLGALLNQGASTVLELRGSYSFSWTAGEPFHEQDSVSVQWVRADRALVGLVGAGLTYDLAARQGIRADVRLHISPNTVHTEVTATPSIVAGAPARSFASATTPSVQYSNNPAVNSARSTLSAPALTAFGMRQGQGAQIDTAVTVGWFWRF